MAYTLTQEFGASSSAASPWNFIVGTSGVGTNLVAGNVAVLVVHTFSSSVTVTAVTDSKSNTWEEVVTARAGSITERVCIWRAKNIAAGTGGTTITVTQSGAASRYYNIYEFSGVGDYGNFTAVTIENATASSAPSLTLVSCPANSIIIGGISIQDTTFTVGSGYTSAYNTAANYREAGQYLLDSGTSGNKTFDCTLGVSANWNCAAVAFGETASNSKRPLWLL